MGLGTIPGKFEMEEALAGVSIRAVRDPLTMACLTADEVDREVEALKSELDWLARRMKRRIDQRKTEGVFDA